MYLELLGDDEGEEALEHLCSGGCSVRYVNSGGRGGEEDLLRVSISS